jgi:hypothetical protein
MCNTRNPIDCLVTYIDGHTTIKVVPKLSSSYNWIMLMSVQKHLAGLPKLLVGVNHGCEHGSRQLCLTSNIWWLPISIRSQIAQYRAEHQVAP